jgi:hypothetical protein
MAQAVGKLPHTPSVFLRIPHPDASSRGWSAISVRDVCTPIPYIGAALNKSIRPSNAIVIKRQNKKAKCEDH